MLEEKAVNEEALLGAEVWHDVHQPQIVMNTDHPVRKLGAFPPESPAARHHVGSFQLLGVPGERQLANVIPAVVAGEVAAQEQADFGVPILRGLPGCLRLDRRVGVPGEFEEARGGSRVQSTLCAARRLDGGASLRVVYMGLISAD